jgi:hypothetical protein
VRLQVAKPVAGSILEIGAIVPSGGYSAKRGESGEATVMRRQLCAVFAMLLLARMEAAIACSYAPGHGPPSDEELFAMASTVFVGHLVRVEEAGVVSERELLTFPPWAKVDSLPPREVIEAFPPWPAVEGTLRVVEVFKGQPPADGKIRAPIYMHCVGPLLLAGLDYVIFLYEGNFVRSSVESRGVFSRPTREQDGEHKRLQEKLRELRKNQQK